MTPRERVLTALDHREPDRVPFNLRLSPELAERFGRESGGADYAAHFGHDVRYVRLATPPKPEELPRSEWRPHASEEVISACAAEARRLRDAGLAACSAYACGVYEEAKLWLGDEAALTMPYEDPGRLSNTLERITEIKMSVYGAYARAGVDIVWMGDDLGAQQSLIMSPEHYREFYRPRHRRIVDHLRAINPDVKIAFHACGHVTELVPDLVELGVDVLEAVQAECMDMAALKREFGGEICFWGAVGNQSVLARLEPGGVVDSVRRTLSVAAPGGGYIAAPCHTVTADIPWENVLAFHEAVRRYGAYPSPGT